MNDLKNISNNKKVRGWGFVWGHLQWPLQSHGFSSQKTRGLISYRHSGVIRTQFSKSSVSGASALRVERMVFCFPGPVPPARPRWDDTKRDFGHPNFFQKDVGRSTPPKVISNKKSYEITTCSCWMLLAILCILHCFFRQSIGFLDHFDWWNFEGSLSRDRYPSVPHFQSSVKTVFIANLYSEYSNLLC